MDSVRQLIRSRLSVGGLNMAEVSRRIGKNHAYLQQFLERGVPAHLPEEVRERLGPILRINAADLKQSGSSRNTVIPPSFSLAPDNQKMPVLGMAEGGPDGSYEWNGQVIEYIDPPPYLVGAVDAYAVYVTGTSMSPRYEPGERLYIHPGKPITIGSYILVQTKPEAPGEAPLAFLKRLSKRTSTKLILEQFTPPKTVEISLSDVVSIHRIVGSGEA